MAKKKNTKTFAARAQEIIKKYKRASYDATEKAELDSALQKLADEQETYKQENGIGEYSSEKMAEGGDWRAVSGYTIPQELGTNQQLNSFENYAANQGLLPEYGKDQVWGKEHDAAYGAGQAGFQNMNILANSNLQSKIGYAQPSNPINAEFANVRPDVSLSPIQRPDPTVSDSLAPVPPVQQPDNPISEGNELEPYSTSIVPSLIGAGAEVAGNLYLANRAKKFADENQLKAPQMQASTIDLSRARESARRDYNTGSNIAKRNLRTAGSRGANLAGTGAAVTGLTKAKEGAVSGLYGQEADYNARARAQATNQNAQMRYQTGAANQAIRARGEADQQAYISSAIGAIPQAGRDILASRQRDAEINYMGDDYSIMQDPNRKFYQSKRLYKTPNAWAK